jgi:protein KRI1
MGSSSKSGKKKNLLDDDDSLVGSTSSSSSSSSDDSIVDIKLKVNKKYAKQYQNRKQREELHQIRERGDDIDSDESSSEEEDEDGNLLTNSVNLQFLKTIKAIKKKETSIYDPSKRFFEEIVGDGDIEDKEERDKKKTKPQTFKDVLREQILEQMDEEENGSSAKDKDSEPSKSRFAYDAQQEEIRNSFLKKSQEAEGDESDDDGDDWMVVKKKETTSPADDAEVIEEFNEIEKLTSTQSKDKLVDPRGEIADGDQYLLEFFKNKKWIDKDNDYANDDDSLDNLDEADDFEAKYNFRFEQAASEVSRSGASLSVQTYARGQTMNTVRRTDTTRKDKRQSRKERKAAERKAKEEQLKRLKNAKREETNQKLAQIKSVLGSIDQEAVDEVAIMKMLEGDYDPETFETAMNQAYGDDFYEKEDEEWKTDLDVREGLKADEDGKGVIGQDDAEGGMYDTYTGEEETEEQDETGEDFEDQGEEEGWDEEEDGDMIEGGEEETELEKKLKTKMQEELYKLDYEDIVAGMPTRFKYRQVEKNNYGLSTQEILMARDTSLKQFVSLKKMAPYNEGDEYHVDSKKRRRFRMILKQDLEEQEAQEKANTNENKTEDQDESQGERNEEPKKKKRRRLKKGKKKDKDAIHTQIVEISDGRKNNAELSAEDREESKKRRRKKKGKKESSSESSPQKEGFDTNKDVKKDLDEGPISEKKYPPASVESKKKRKKKKKKKEVMGMSASRLASYGL